MSTGPDHHLCDAARKTIKRLEIDMKSKSGRSDRHTQGIKGPASNLSWRDRDLFKMKKSQSMVAKSATALPEDFNPGRRGSLQRQDAYRTQHSQEDPPQIPVAVELPTIEKDDFMPDASNPRRASPKGGLARAPSIGESVMQYVELPNYEPNHVTPHGSYSSSPKGSPSQARRSSLGKDILKLALHKMTIELEDHIEHNSDSDENRNVKELYDRNELVEEEESPTEYIDTYSNDARAFSSVNAPSRPKSAFAERDSKAALESRPKTAPNIIVKLKDSHSQKSQKWAVRFRQPDRVKSSEDLDTSGGLTVWHTNSNPTTPVGEHGFTPVVSHDRLGAQNGGNRTESGGPRLTRSPTAPSNLPNSSGSPRRKQAIVTYEVHRSKCCIPGPHTIDIHNSYSITPGPHSAIRSLLGRSTLSTTDFPVPPWLSLVSGSRSFPIGQKRSSSTWGKKAMADAGVTVPVASKFTNLTLPREEFIQLLDRKASLMIINNVH